MNILLKFFCAAFYKIVIKYIVAKKEYHKQPLCLHFGSLPRKRS